MMMPSQHMHVCMHCMTQNMAEVKAEKTPYQHTQIVQSMVVTLAVSIQNINGKKGHFMLEWYFYRLVLPPDL
mgnify:FL=1